MKKLNCFYPGFLMMLFLVLNTTIFAQTGGLNETYRNIDKIKITIGAGDLTIAKNSSDAVELVAEYDQNNTDVSIEVKGKTLTIKEKSVGYNRNGRTNWSLNIPDDKILEINVGAGEVEIKDVLVMVEANIGAGDFHLNNIKGKVQLNTGTGNIRVNEAKGEFSLNSGTGTLWLDKVTGTISANSGTGNVNAEQMSITGNSSMNSGTGRVSLTLGSPILADLGLNSGTNDSSLDFNGYAFDGTLKMQCDKKRGKIKAPFSFTDEETKGNSRNETLEKTKRFGNSGVEVEIGSGTGTASVDQ